MPAYSTKSQTVAAKQFNQFASDTKHEDIVVATGGGNHWGMEQPLIEVPKGLQTFGPTVFALKNPNTGELTKVNNKDWIVYTEHGSVLVLPDELFNQLYQKL